MASMGRWRAVRVEEGLHRAELAGELAAAPGLDEADGQVALARNSRRS